MRFGVLGPLAVWTDEGTRVRVPELKVRALLAAVLVRPGHAVPADRLADDLWAGRPPGNPVNTLQTKVSQLRRVLERAEPGAKGLVRFEAGGYLLAVEPEAVDAGRFAALLARARASADTRTRAALLSDALALWRGPAFADFADDAFARTAAAALEEQRLTALEEQAEARLDLGEHGILAGELADLVAAHPWRERLRAAHLRALFRAGRQSDALARYADYRTRLADELALDPGPELAAVHQAILEQAPELAGSAPPATSAAHPRTNLPAVPSELVGRERDVEEVRERLDRSRLVTLTGPGGVGKTSLALAVAAGAAGAHPDGVWLVEVGSCGGVPDLADSVAATLEIREGAAGTGDPVERLAAALRGRNLLLVLDNCERLVDAAATLVGRLLRDAAGLRVLATCREPLAVSGEAVHAVRPLPVPAPGTADPAALRRSAAVRLFVGRAADAAPGFALDARNAEAVATVCRRLDGLPLALELAAARVRALGVGELARRMDDRFRVLGGGGRRDAPARQRTLRAVIDWSWDLLDGPERTVLRRLAVHPDSCTLDAATVVCGEDDPAAGPDVLDVLARLVDRSLVVAAEGPGGTRYRLLESVAAYCVERLREAGDLEPARRRHAAYYTALAERAWPSLHGPDQRRLLLRLDAEAANLRRALATAAECGDAGQALRLANALSWPWFLRGRYGEAHRMLETALEVPAAAERDEHAAARAQAAAWRAGLALFTGGKREGTGIEAWRDMAAAGSTEAARARAAWFLAHAHVHFGNLSVSRELAAEAMAGARAADDPWTLAAVLSTRAVHALFSGDLARVRRDGAESLRVFEELGDRWGRLAASGHLAALAGINGDYDEATRLHRDALHAAEDLGLWSDVSEHLAGLGRIALLRGDDAQAAELHERALRLAREQSDVGGQEYAAVGLGLLARRRHRLDDAERHLLPWLEWNRTLDADQGRALILAELGFVAELRGDAGRARVLHLEGLAAARRMGDPRAVALAVEGLAGALSLAGDAPGAVRPPAAAAALRAGVGAALPPAERGDVDRVGARLRDVLGEEAFAAEHAGGADGDLDELLRDV
ncbi:BTAD domain-containing putative transcriptional regulator [Actinomadura sediminis]|uniref:BTAD domain-containing putative transcriptional regulator n=1 Tax=Actinomadura sediminis TaxID=1038904 RepID=A0ABW3EQN5_9ACTN